MQFVDQGMQSMPMAGWADFISGILMFVGSAVVLLFAGGVVLIAKVSLYFVLAVGPIFIACLAFPPIAAKFEGWLSMILNSVFLLAFMAGLAGIVLAIGGQFLSAMANATTANAMADAFSWILICAALAFVAWHMKSMVGGLVGGSAAGGAGAFVAAAVMRMVMGGGNQDSNKNKDNGGSIGNAGKGGSNTGPSGSGGSTPAYRRQTMDQLAKNTSRNQGV